MKGATSRGWMPVAGLMAAALIPVSAAQAAPVLRIVGQLSGLVTDATGAPQQGASVALYNRQDRLLQRIPTDFSGIFSFDELLPDVYSIRITLASFVPAIKEFVQVKPGMRSLLGVNLSRISSSVQIVATTPAVNGLMNDDWKWTLRADSSLRPILRMFPVADVGKARLENRGERSAFFSGSRGMLRISATDGAQTVADTGEADLGTQFAFATSLHGGNHLKLSGNVGYASASGAPAAAIRTTLSRDIAGTSPALSVTVRQMFLPFRGPQGSFGSPGDSSLPALRSVAVSYGDKTNINDTLSVEYGAEFDMVSFIDRLHYFSPYARLNYALPRGKFDLTYTSGNARPELGFSSTDSNADLQRDLAALSVVPHVTLENGRARVQRGDNYEAGLTQRFGSREYRLSGYVESVSNATLTIANPDASLFTGDLLPDLFSNTAVFNAGHYGTTGYTASVTQDLGSNYHVTAMFGTIGVMTPGAHAGLAGTAEDLRQLMESDQRPAVTLRASGTVRETGTRFVASYQWTDYAGALSGPQFSTQSLRPGPGFNVLFRQPLPSFPGMPWRIEASAELRNLLAQGYLPLTITGGRQLLLVNTPRSVRGGLAFVF